MPSKSSGSAKKKRQSTGSDTGLNKTIKTEKAQADSTTTSGDDGHPIHGKDKKWAYGDRVLCRYMNAENIYYEAKVMGLKVKKDEPAYAIHYPGWSARHDEIVPHSQALLRFKDYSHAEAEKAKEEIRRAQQAKKSRKRSIDDGRPITQDITGSGKRGKRSIDDGRPSTLDITVKRGTGDSGRRPASSAEEHGKDLPQIVLSVPLRRILLDDEKLINQSYFLPKLPVRIPVYDIVQKYREKVSEDLQRSALDFLDYFEASIGTVLLYKFERPMFNDLQEKLEKEPRGDEVENEAEDDGDAPADGNKEQNLDAKRVCYAKHFGLVHLLRMFVRFSDMLKYTDSSERSLNVIHYAQDFVMFLDKHHHDYYNVDEDYVLASADYHKRVWANNA